MKGTGKWIPLVLLALTGCTALQLVGTPALERISETLPKRYLKIAILSEGKPTDGMVNTVKEGFARLEEKTGIGLGAITFQRVDLKEVKTYHQVYRRLFEQIIPKGPQQADLYVCFTYRIFVEDLFAAVGIGTFILGECEVSFRRFILMRVHSPSILEHEVAHAFGAAHMNDPGRNARIVAARKWRMFDGWYLQNHLPVEYPEVEKRDRVGTLEGYHGAAERTWER